MGNVLRVFKRDVVRLFKAPAALVVVLALIVLPSLYTWFNVAGFWNPYDNTGNLRVCVVNEDAGATTDITGQLDLGSQIVSQLEENTQLDWTFTSRDEAMEEVQSGRAYAAFIVPKNFSANIASLVTGDFRQPQLEYYVNEKAGPVSTKITDTGASTLDETINSTFVSTVSSVVAGAVDTWLADSQDKIDQSNATVSAQFNKAIEALGTARGSIEGLNEACRAASDKAASAKSRLSEAKGTIALMSSQLESVSQLTCSAQSGMNQFVSLVAPALDDGSFYASQAAAGANAAIGLVAGSVTGSKENVEEALAGAQDALEQNKAIVATLKELAEKLPEGDAGKALIMQVIEGLEKQNDDLEAAIASASEVYASVSDAAGTIAHASDSVNTAFQGSLNAAANYRGTLSSSTLPAINSGLSQISGTSGSLAGAVSNQTLLIDQATLVIDQLLATLSTTSSALGATDALLANLRGSLETARDDLSALGTAGMLSELLGEDSIDAGKVADFMLSPTQLETEKLYPLNAYGSAMAPLFTNLTLWIGVFMLMVILKQEMDSDGIPNLTLSQRYLGRGLFLAVLASLQAIVCCAGNLAMGVQAVSVPLYFLTAVVASLSYLSIQYALSVLFQHIGKGICVVLVFVQIPGATGLYPVEMTQPFFQAVYPFFPFTYGINAMRETIAGFYGSQWAHMIAVLLLFFAVFLVAGLLARPYLTNLNRLFAKQISQSDILNGEDVQVPARRLRAVQLIRAMSVPEAYRARLHDHAGRFSAWYPTLKHGGWAAGVAVPVLLTAVLSLTQSEKVVVLTMWLVWLVLVLGYLVVLEYIRDSFERRLALEGMSESELLDLYSRGNTLEDGSGERSAPAEGDLRESAACRREEHAFGAAAFAPNACVGKDSRNAGAEEGAAELRGRHARKGGDAQ